MAQHPHRILEELDRETASADLRTVCAALDRAKPALVGAILDRLRHPLPAQALTLKLLNLCLGRHHFRTRGTTLLSRPYGLEVDPINNCNLACPGCVHSSRSKELRLFDWNSGMLSPDRFAAFLDRYGPYALQIALCNYGEPTLSPHTPELIRLAKNYLLLTRLSTNMTARRFDAEAYAASGLDFMTVSLDGATQPVYERFRKKGDLDLAFANIRALVEAKRRLGKERPFISWQFLAFEHNAHEIEPALAIAKRLGVDQFRVAEPFDVSWDDPEVRPAAVAAATYDLTRNPEQTLADNWNPFGAASAAPAIEREFARSWTAQLTPQFEADSPRSEHVCHWLYKNMVMDATGRIIPCCAAPQPAADLVFAQFNGAESEDSFNSEKYRIARISFADKSAAAASIHKPHCVDCDWFSDQQAAQIDSAQVRNYLRASGAFRTEAPRFLSEW